MDWAIVMPWVVGTNSIFTLGTTIYLLLTSGAKKTATDLDAYKKANNEEIAKLLENLIEHERRIQSVEADIRYLPNAQQAHQLELAVERLNGRIGTLDEKLKPIDALARRLQEFLVRKVEVKG